MCCLGAYLHVWAQGGTVYTCTLRVHGASIPTVHMDERCIQTYRVTCMYPVLYIQYICTLHTYPLDSKLHSFEVYNGDGPIASLSNAPLHSLPGGEGQEGPLLKGSNTLHIDKSERSK